MAKFRLSSFLNLIAISLLWHVFPSIQDCKNKCFKDELESRIAFEPIHEVSLVDTIHHSKTFFAKFKLRNYYESLLDEEELKRFTCQYCLKTFQKDQRIVCDDGIPYAKDQKCDLKLFMQYLWSHITCKVGAIDQSYLEKNYFVFEMTMQSFICSLDKSEYKFLLQTLLKKNLLKYFEGYVYDRLVVVDIGQNLNNFDGPNLFSKLKRHTGKSSLNIAQVKRVYFEYAKYPETLPGLKRLSLLMAFFEKAAFRAIIDDMISSYTEDKKKLYEQFLIALECIPSILVDGKISLDYRVEFAMKYIALHQVCGLLKNAKNCIVATSKAAEGLSNPKTKSRVIADLKKFANEASV